MPKRRMPDLCSITNMFNKHFYLSRFCMSTIRSITSVWDIPGTSKCSRESKWPVKKQIKFKINFAFSTCFKSLKFVLQGLKTFLCSKGNARRRKRTSKSGVWVFRLGGQVRVPKPSEGHSKFERVCLRAVRGIFWLGSGKFSIHLLVPFLGLFSRLYWLLCAPFAQFHRKTSLSLAY